MRERWGGGQCGVEGWRGGREGWVRQGRSWQGGEGIGAGCVRACVCEVFRSVYVRV